MTETVTLTCSLCHFAIVPDDIAFESERHVIICLGCWARHTETGVHMDKDLRREVERLLAGLG